MGYRKSCMVTPTVIPSEIPIDRYYTQSVSLLILCACAFTGKDKKVITIHKVTLKVSEIVLYSSETIFIKKIKFIFTFDKQFKVKSFRKTY